MLGHRFGNSLEAMYGTGVGYAMMPALRKLYKGKDEELKEAIDRHLLPYISEMSLGNCIMGAALAMEEEIAAGSEGIDGDDVITLKSSLMGPFAGFGDSPALVYLCACSEDCIYPICVRRFRTGRTSHGAIYPFQRMSGKYLVL